MPDVALGTKVFTRVDKLERLLDSVPDFVTKVYIADDGKPTGAKTDLYSQEHHFDLEIIELEYDAGLGRGRREIVNRLAEKYLLIVDPDHTVPKNADVLLDQLDSLPRYGGIAGTIVEPESNRLYLEGQDFLEDGDRLIRHPTYRQKTIEMVAGHPLIAFDFVPNAALFRAQCLEDYCWDPEYVIDKEHVDFFVGHWKRTNWQFGVSPSVIFEHHPGGDSDYMKNRMSGTKRSASKTYFLEKWGYSEDVVVDWVWYDGGRVVRSPFSYMQDAWDIYRMDGPTRLIREAATFLYHRLR